MAELQRLNAGHASAVLAFELANRTYFATSISDRGDNYFDQFTDRYAALLADQDAGLGAYYVLVAEDGSILGRFNLFFVHDKTANLGYRVARHVAGHGVATTTVREVCRLAASQHELRTLRAATSHENVASQKVLTKAGFAVVGPAGPADLGGKTGDWYQRRVGADDPWAQLAQPFVDDAYVTVKGQVRTFVIHQQLLLHLQRPPARVLDVGGGAGHQSLPLARMGFDVTILDPSATMLDRARQRLSAEPAEVRRRLHLVEGAGEDAATLLGGQQFAGVLCHGVVMYLDRPEPFVAAICDCVTPGGIVSMMALNAATLAIRPALSRHWTEAMAAFDATGEVGVLGTDTRADTVEGLSDLLRGNGVAPQAWYGVWLFSDWMDLSEEDTDVASLAEVELEASRRDPYRQLSRAFHLIGRRAESART